LYDSNAPDGEDSLLKVRTIELSSKELRKRHTHGGGKMGQREAYKIVKTIIHKEITQVYSDTMDDSALGVAKKKRSDRARVLAIPMTSFVVTIALYSLVPSTRDVLRGIVAIIAGVEGSLLATVASNVHMLRVKHRQ